MDTPVTAFAWELWRRHRTRLWTIAGIILALVVIYPKLCAIAGLNLNSADVLEDIARRFASRQNLGPYPAVYGACLIFLACGPTGVMFLSLLYVIWMFTFTEFDPKTGEPMKYPARVFNLPVSTPFMFGWMLVAGLAGVAALYGIWSFLVPRPHLEIFAAYENCFGWLTLLVVAQGIVWALGAWPFMRMLVLMIALLGFSYAPARRDIFESPLFLPAFFVAGAVLARAGMQKMRHGQWQGWLWNRAHVTTASRVQLPGPEKFSSPARAQLWFEWRRFGRGACLTISGLALIPVAIHLLIRSLGRLGPLHGDTMPFFAGYLVTMPTLVSFFLSISPPKTDLPFLLIRPATNGQITMAMLKAMALGTALSWVAVLAALNALPLLGDFHKVTQNVSPSLSFRVILVLGLVFLTWRTFAVNLCFSLPGKRWLAAAPMCFLYLGVPIGFKLILFLVSDESESRSVVLRSIPAVLLGLIVVKFLLAFLAFGLSVRRGLLAPSAAAGYLAVWSLLAAAGLGAMTMLFRIDKPTGLPFYTVSLAIILLVPLARIGLCPLALAWNRHT